jgi:hypothetical protein
VWVVKTVVGAPRPARRRTSPLLEQFADALQHDERRVSLVEVPHGRRRSPARAGHADAADAEDDLLLDARLPVAAVEARRQVAIPRRVLLEVRVEQEQLHAPER